MDWQLLITCAVVALAAAYLFRQTWRSWSAKKAGCGGGCGCADKATTPAGASLIAPEQLLGRLKRPS